MAAQQAAATQDQQVVRAAIHPAIGIARVGNSREHYYFAPETDRPPPMPDGDMKDATGALKRQAQRFRVYGYNAAGEAVTELTAENADIEWTVHVANSKAAWYRFEIALDIPEAGTTVEAPPSLQRNDNVAGSARHQLIIDPGARTISGVRNAGPAFWFDTGEFCGKRVYLGELRTDEAGRLVFLGGRGVSASCGGAPPTTFANNDGWHDDVADGPVRARVQIGGREIPVDPAWVVVAPPNYAPDIVGVRTLYDLLTDLYIQSGWLTFPDRVSFNRDVLPILARMSGQQWVNQGFAERFGWAGRDYFLDPAYLARLASDQPVDAELRNQIYQTFRDLDRDGESPVPWPWTYGDSMSLPPVSARQYCTLSATQMRILELWAAGEFDSDLDLEALVPYELDQVTVAQQPATLDRAALTFCLADAFHPGCEVTWPIRHASMYAAPYRLRHRAGGSPQPALESQLTPATVRRVDGPLYAQSPGDLTRWMAVPWQTDTVSCRSGYTLGYGPRYDPFMPTFWATRVPNQVLTRHDYDIVMDMSRPLEERRAAFSRRASWLRWLGGNYDDQLKEMVSEFGRLGVVQTLPGPDDGAFGSHILVERSVGFRGEVHPHRNLVTLHVPQGANAAVEAASLAASSGGRVTDPDHVATGVIDKISRLRRRP